MSAFVGMAALITSQIVSDRPEVADYGWQVRSPSSSCVCVRPDFVASSPQDLPQGATAHHGGGRDAQPTDRALPSVLKG